MHATCFTILSCKGGLNSDILLNTSVVIHEKLYVSVGLPVALYVSVVLPVEFYVNVVLPVTLYVCCVTCSNLRKCCVTCSVGLPVAVYTQSGRLWCPTGPIPPGSRPTTQRGGHGP